MLHNFNLFRYIPFTWVLPFATLAGRQDSMDLVLWLYSYTKGAPEKD